MRIAEVSPLWFPVPPTTHGGTERCVYDLTEALVRRGHEVTLFAATGSCTSAELCAQGDPVCRVPDAPSSLSAVRECVMLARLAAVRERFDIVHCHTEFFHAAVLRELGPRLVTTIHWQTDRRDRQDLFAHFTDLQVVAISASQAVAIPPSNHLGTVHHGIEVSRFRQGQGIPGHAAFIGRMTDQKRPDLAIRIAQAAGLPVELAGPVDLGNPRYFDERVRPLLGARARYIGEIDDREKQRLIGGASVLLMPIDWPEPFGLVMIEAMACGTPVVAWRRGSVPELVEEGVTGFAVSNFDDAVAAVHAARTLDRSRIRERFEARFTSERMAEGYERLFEQVLERAGRERVATGSDTPTVES